MAHENIQIDHGNFAIGRDGTFFTMDHDDNKLIEKNSSGTVLFSYFLDTDILEVSALKFDGYFYWSLERQGTIGFRIRKWEIGTDNLVRNRREFSYVTDGVNSYDCNAFAVEYYDDMLDNVVLAGSTTFDVTDGSIVRVGDILIIGPSTASGFEGLYDTVSVTNKVGTTLTVSPALSRDFSPNEPIYFSRNLWVFSDTATAGLSGALYKFRITDGFLQTVNVSNLFNLVRGAVFFKRYVMFVRAGEVIWLDPDSTNINRSQAIDNLDVNRGDHITCHDLAGFSDTLYRLEQEHVFFNVGAGIYQTEDWAPSFNYNTSSTIAEIYFVGVKAARPIVHKSAAGVDVADTQTSIRVFVLDQFRTPVFNRLVTFASTGGSVNPASDTTDSEGEASTTYTASSSTGKVTVTATVT